jgi:hypothetical protein
MKLVRKRIHFDLGENEMSILCSLNEDESVSVEQVKEKLGKLLAKFFSGGTPAVRQTLYTLDKKKFIKKHEELFTLTKYGCYQKEILQANGYRKRLYMIKKK